ncbi:hypothetical protein AsAng_0020040 [Aureispira anguillae]|uniref:Uncharacterized protein n=1 Tax=Aureispira anguillae TaxID=2864201 RepID=A0A916DSU3_9BACT|nr:hypothetical protein AsAng_0020040 [Aureispira anguillae]
MITPSNLSYENHYIFNTKNKISLLYFLVEDWIFVQSISKV